MKVGVPFIMSTASTRPPEEVAEANGVDGARWYQLYWCVLRSRSVSTSLNTDNCPSFLNSRPHSHEVTLSLLSRVKKVGFTTLVVTLDTMLLGWRPHDLDTAYLPFAHGVGIQVRCRFHALWFVSIMNILVLIDFPCLCFQCGGVASCGALCELRIVCYRLERQTRCL